MNDTQQQETPVPYGYSATQPNPAQTPLQPPTPQYPPVQPVVPPSPIAKKKFNWVRLVRVLIWGLVAIALPIAISLKRNARLSASYADGSYASKDLVGNWIFIVAIVVGAINLIWGITRWFLRWYREKWTAGKVIGKLIGGGIWRIAVIAPVVLISFLFLAPLVVRSIQIDNSISDVSTSFDKISLDHDTKQITADEYITYLTDSIYNLSRLPQKYVGTSESTPYFDLAQIVVDNLDELSPETVKYFYEKFSLSKVDMTSEKSDAISLSRNAYADETKTGDVLDFLSDAVMSENGHFVIFYTTIGSSAITDESARSIGATLEDAVVKYHDIFYQGWHYQKVTYGGDENDARRAKLQRVLSNNNIDENALDKSLPVYVVNYDGEDLAHYTSTTANNITKILAKMISLDVSAENYNATFPYIAIKADSVNDQKKEEVITHELSHHYANSYCLKNHLFGGACNHISMVLSEATAQYSALTIVDKEPENSFINAHHQNYIDFATCLPADKIIAETSEKKCGSYSGSNLGYSATAFLQNYGENVPDFQKNMFDILAKTEIHDMLDLLYETAGEQNFRTTMVNLAQRNLTNDYDKVRSFYAKNMPPGQKLPCLDFCDGNYHIDEASSQYFYISTKDNIDYVGISRHLGNINVSVLGKSGDKWKVIHSNFTEESSDGMLAISEYRHYDALAIIATNYSLSPATFGLNIYSEELVNTIESAGDLASSIDESFSSIGSNCYSVNTDSFFDIPLRLYGLMSDGVRFVDMHDTEDDFSSIAELIDDEANQISQGLSDAREELAKYNIMICQNSISDGISFNEAIGNLQKALGFSIKFYDETDGNTRTGILVGFDLINRSGSLYTLIQNDGELGLLTVNVMEK